MFVFQGEKGRSLPGQKGDEVQILFSSGHALSVTSLQENTCIDVTEGVWPGKQLSGHFKAELRAFTFHCCFNVKFISSGNPTVAVLCSTSNVYVPQGDQGLQGPPGPFEYVDPPEDLYIKGEQVGSTVVLL